MKTFVDCWLEATNPSEEDCKEAREILRKMLESVGGPGQKSFCDAFLESYFGEQKSVH